MGSGCPQSTCHTWEDKIGKRVWARDTRTKLACLGHQSTWRLQGGSFLEGYFTYCVTQWFDYVLGALRSSQSLSEHFHHQSPLFNLSSPWHPLTCLCLDRFAYSGHFL